MTKGPCGLNVSCLFSKHSRELYVHARGYLSLFFRELTSYFFREFYVTSLSAEQMCLREVIHGVTEQLMTTDISLPLVEACRPVIGAQSSGER